MHYNMVLILRTATQPELATMVNADLSKVISDAMAPFDEDPADSNDRSSHAFWDWWVIGGRYSGSVLASKLGHERIDEFTKRLTDRKVMVKGFICGKEELADPDTEQMVDTLWREMFPDSGLEKCPLFKHGSPSQYDKRGELPYDVCKVGDVPATHGSARIALVQIGYDNKPRIEEMLTHEFYNGATWQQSDWDGQFGPAVERFNKKLQRYREPSEIHQDDLVVTVDYHS